MNLTNGVVNEYRCQSFNSDYVTFLPRMQDKIILNFLTCIAKEHRVALKNG